VVLFVVTFNISAYGTINIILTYAEAYFPQNKASQVSKQFRRAIPVQQKLRYASDKIN